MQASPHGWQPGGKEELGDDAQPEIRRNEAARQPAKELTSGLLRGKQ